MNRPHLDLTDIIGIKTPLRVKEETAIKEKQRRKKLKISQKKLAELSHVSYASIRRFEETGEISFYSLLSIAQVLGYLEDFHHLFETPHYQTIEEVIDASR